MNNWSYTQHKNQETELLRRAQDERFASANINMTSVSPNTLTAWVGERLIEIGTRLTSEPARANSDFTFAEITR
jgi:hypothetical protein